VFEPSYAQRNVLVFVVANDRDFRHRIPGGLESGVNEAARRLIEERMEQVGQSITVAEAQLAEAERALGGLDDMQTEARWVSEALSHFDAVWDAMTITNRGRLVRAVVRGVEIKESTGEVTTVLNDLCADQLRAPDRESEHPQPPMEASA